MQRPILLAACVAVAAACEAPTRPAELRPDDVAPVSAGGLSCPVDGVATITDINPPAAVSSAAVALNDRGEVIVTASSGNFIWSVARGHRPLPLPAPQAINNSGVVVGSNEGGSSERRAQWWSEEMGLRTLPVPAGYRAGFAADINDVGVVVGGARGPTPPVAEDAYHEIPDQTMVPIAWVAGVPSLLPLENQGYFMELYGAAGINDRNEIFGGAFVESYSYELLWSPFVDGGLPQSIYLPGGDGGSATDINNAGQVTGTTSSEWDANNAVLWDASTDFQYLHRGPEETAATALNDAGVVVGHLREFNEDWYEWGVRLPVRWTPDRVLERLPLPPGATSGYAVDVNERGDIAGVVEGRAVLWTTDQAEVATLRELQARVGDLRAAGVIRDDDASALEASIARAIVHLQAGRSLPAEQVIRAVLERVERLVSSGRIPRPLGSALRHTARCLIEAGSPA